MFTDARKLLAAALACSLPFAAAAPYLPSDGAQVVEQLPNRTDPAYRELQRLRSALAASPQNLPLAVRLAHRYIDTGRRTGDPRYLGHAQAVLAPWWHRADPPETVRLLRATILQSLHRFPEALADLDAVLAANPGNAQALLTRATILQVQGRYEPARQSCARLDGRAAALAVTVCRSGLQSLTGDSRRGYQALEEQLRRQPDMPADLKAWALTLLAEIAQRQGRHADAEAHYRAALALDGEDSYLLGAYADFLLDRGRPAEAAALLKDRTRVDGLLLRQAIALKRLNAPEAGRQIAALQSRFAAAMRRGDTVHQREQARFELHLRGNAAAALELAKRNWQVQKEPADLRILLESAIAANAAEDVKAARDWMRQTGLEDSALAAPAAGRREAG